MRDFGRSDDPRVQAQLDRLGALTVPQGRLGLETIRALLERLGDPHKRLPPVFHVAGTNGKGSVCAFLRAMLEADGKRVHVTTSPHLVRYNERIRLAGELISDEALADILEEVLDKGSDLNPSFFEITIAAAFLAFSRNPADACVVEVGLGGRFDATNVLEPEALAACGIAALGIDHERFLLAPEEGVPTEPMARIAFEKAGIAKAGMPLVTMGEQYPPEAQAQIAASAQHAGSPLFAVSREAIGAAQRLELTLTGAHQSHNAALAMEMLRQQSAVNISDEAMKNGALQTRWPGRMQQLGDGPLTAIDYGFEIWLDGGHNLDAARAIRRAFETDERLKKLTLGPFKLDVVLGMLANKNAESFIAEIAPIAKSLVAIPIGDQDCHPPEKLCQWAIAAGIEQVGAAANITDALNRLNTGRPNDEWQPVLIAGSLYLAGEVLRANDEIPD